MKMINNKGMKNAGKRVTEVLFYSILFYSEKYVGWKQ
jgi:hypothetical protein